MNKKLKLELSECFPVFPPDYKHKFKFLESIGVSLIFPDIPETPIEFLVRCLRHKDVPIEKVQIYLQFYKENTAPFDINSKGTLITFLFKERKKIDEYLNSMLKLEGLSLLSVDWNVLFFILSEDLTLRQAEFLEPMLTHRDMKVLAESKDKDGKNIFNHISLQWNNVYNHIIYKLYKSGVNLNLEDYMGRNTLHLVRLGSGVTSFLREFKIDYRKRDRKGDTPLLSQCKAKNNRYDLIQDVEFFDFLRLCGCSIVHSKEKDEFEFEGDVIFDMDSKGRNALMLLLKNIHDISGYDAAAITKLVSGMLKFAKNSNLFDPGMTDSKGRNLFYYLVVNSHYKMEVIPFLLSNFRQLGVKENLRSKRGLLPMSESFFRPKSFYLHTAICMEEKDVTGIFKQLPVLEKSSEEGYKIIKYHLFGSGSSNEKSPFSVERICIDLDLLYKKIDPLYAPEGHVRLFNLFLRKATEFAEMIMFDNSESVENMPPPVPLFRLVKALSNDMRITKEIWLSYCPRSDCKLIDLLLRAFVAITKFRTYEVGTKEGCVSRNLMEELKKIQAERNLPFYEATVDESSFGFSDSFLKWLDFYTTCPHRDDCPFFRLVDLFIEMRKDTFIDLEKELYSTKKILFSNYLYKTFYKEEAVMSLREEITYWHKGFFFFSNLQIPAPKTTEEEFKTKKIWANYYNFILLKSTRHLDDSSLFHGSKLPQELWIKILIFCDYAMFLPKSMEGKSHELSEYNKCLNEFFLSFTNDYKWLEGQAIDDKKDDYVPIDLKKTLTNKN